MFKPKIREYRKRLNISQQELARISGISQNYISNLENEKYNVTIVVLILICIALETTPNDLLDWNKIKSYNIDEIKLILNKNS